MQHFSLSDLAIRIKRSIAINFPESIWVEAEIAQVNENRGNWYIDLVQKEEGSTTSLAQISAVIWRSNAARISRAIDAELDTFLDTGQQVLLEVDVDFHETYGLKLIIRNIDKNFTEGILAREKAETIAALIENGLWDKNRSVPIPSVIQHIAVISNENAAGYLDFIHQLTNNNYGYAFQVQLFETAVQGVKAKTELPGQLEKIKNSGIPFDATVIIRGGGSKMDLSIFDDRDVVTAIAHHPIPVLSGIGHEKDESITDMIAAIRLKTPTAVANFLIDKMLYYENTLGIKIDKIHGEIRARLMTMDKTLLRIGERIKSASNHQVSVAKERLDEKTNLLFNMAGWQIKRESEKLDHLEDLFYELDPEKILSKGYSIITHNGQWIKEPVDLSQGETLINHLKGGTITSSYRDYEQEDKK